MDHHFVPFACDFMMKQVAINLRFLFGLIVANKSKKANINWKFAKKSQLILGAAIFGHVCDFVMNNVFFKLNFLFGVVVANNSRKNKHQLEIH